MAQRRRVSVRPAIAVLCSGQGTNLQAILDATRSGRLRARVAVVVADRPQAYALTRARRAGAAAHYLNPKQYATRGRFEHALATVLTSHRVQLVCLAGFMRILSPAFVHQFPRRILNIHPALLPAFSGAHAIHDALAWGVKVTGVTVHLVDDEVDHGPILLQEAVQVLPGDTAARLLQRVHRIEHRLYPKAIQLVLEGRVHVVGRTVRLTSR